MCVEITRVRVEITVVSVVITFVRDKITLRVEITCTFMYSQKLWYFLRSNPD
jgi:hypothetical protein